MSHDKFFNDLNQAALTLGKEKLAEIWGISLKTIHRYLARQTKPQDRLILRYYQNFYNIEEQTTEKFSTAQSDLYSEILFELCFRTIRIEQIERYWGFRGKQICAHLLKSNMIEVNTDRIIKINTKNSYLKNVIHQIFNHMKNSKFKDEKCIFHALNLNQEGFERLQDFLNEFNKKILILNSCESYRGEHSIFLYNLSAKLTSMLLQ